MENINRCGVSMCCKKPTLLDFVNYSKANVDYMEVRADQYLTENLDTLITYQQQYGVKVNSVHLIFSPTCDISNPDVEISDASVKLHIDYIKKLNKLSKIFVLHPSAEPIKDDVRDLYLQTAIKNLKILAGVAEEYGAIIAVENLPRTCLGSRVDEFRILLNSDERLRVCFDVNHLLYDSHHSFIENFGDKIITTHISDYDLIDEKHLLPGEGKIDWKRLYQDFKKANYKGPLTFELEPTSTIRVKRETPLLLEDYRAVFDAIVTEKEIPTFKHELLF